MRVPEGETIPRPVFIMGLVALIVFPILLVPMWTPQHVFSQDRLYFALLAYTSLILAIMGGAHWLLAAGPYGRVRQRTESGIAFAAFVTAWVVLITPLPVGFSLLTAAFFLLILRDQLISETSELPPWFFRSRGHVATVAILASILALIRLIL